MSELQMNIGWLFTLLLFTAFAYHVGYNEAVHNRNKKLFGKDGMLFQYTATLRIFINMLDGVVMFSSFTSGERRAVTLHVKSLVATLEGTQEPSFDITLL